MILDDPIALGCTNDLFTTRIIGPGRAERIECVRRDFDVVELTGTQLVQQLGVVWCQLLAPFPTTGLP